MEKPQYLWCPMDEIAPEQAGWIGDGVSSQEGRKQREDGPSGGGSGEGGSEGIRSLPGQEEARDYSRGGSQRQGALYPNKSVNTGR